MHADPAGIVLASVIAVVLLAFNGYTGYSITVAAVRKASRTPAGCDSAIAN